MMRLLLWICVVSALQPIVHAQDVYDAPVKWETFKIKEFGFSVDFPKQPIRFKQEDYCHQKRSDHFVAYAEEIVYKLTVVTKASPPPGLFCQSSLKFGKQSLENRRKEITEANGIKISQGSERENWQIAKGATLENLWIFEDPKTNQWLELSITGRGTFPNKEQFVNSVSMNPTSASEIDQGASQIFGDRGVDTSFLAPSPPKVTDNSVPMPAPASAGDSVPLVIVSKVKAQYTDEARRRNTQGAVTLRVTFLANGGIGTIAVEKGLKYGLTEQAIAAARKMAFLPQKVAGRLATTTRPVVFTFNIY